MDKLLAQIRGWLAALRPRRFPVQLIQLGVIFAVVVVAVFLLRKQFIPASFGELGHYRTAAVASNAALEPRYAGWQECAICHFDQVEIKNKSYHRTVSCETCHGPASGHANDPIELSPVVPEGRKPCLACHGYLASRPTGFAQIIEERHNPVRACVGCHDPHDPTPPEQPQECSACHNTIARTISISHHAPLACEVCHQVPPEHKQHPRAHLPRKPFEREFCGTCHATGATPPSELHGVDLTLYEIPRVDLSTHGGTFVCWQCHYQHAPEAR